MALADQGTYLTQARPCYNRIFPALEFNVTIGSVISLLESIAPFASNFLGQYMLHCVQSNLRVPNIVMSLEQMISK